MEAMHTSFSDIVEQVRDLDLEAKTELADLLRAWLIEERRGEIAKSARETDREHAEGRTKSGAVKDLIADLYAED